MGNNLWTDANASSLDEAHSKSNKLQQIKTKDYVGMEFNDYQN